MDRSFFERLYKGYLGEHLISGELYARGLEVFRLPADFGFDLVVTNQFRASQGHIEDAASFPFSIQVKSRWIRPEDLSAGPNNRMEAEFAYRLKQDEIDLLIGHPNSAVAFVFYLPYAGGMRSRFFLVCSRDVARLREWGYLRPDGGAYELRVRFRDVPRADRDQLINALLSEKHLTEKGAQRLRAALPTSFDLNWKADVYFQLARSSRSPDHKPLVWKAADLCTDFSDFPKFHQIRLG